jgi:hypothetical protein
MIEARRIEANVAKLPANRSAFITRVAATSPLNNSLNAPAVAKSEKYHRKKTWPSLTIFRPCRAGIFRRIARA